MLKHPTPEYMHLPLDPFILLAPQLSEVRLSILSIVQSGHPALSEATHHYFLHPSKQIRPLIIFLFSRATNGLGQEWNRKLWDATCVEVGRHKDKLNVSLSNPEVLNDWNPSMPDFTANFNLDWQSRASKPHRPLSPNYHFTPPATCPNPTLFSPTYILPTQMRLAETVEMIHTASLLHDDVIDCSSLRRGFPSAPTAFGNKLAVLSGTFVLGRATTALSRLGDDEVTDLITGAVSDLVEGELLQIKETKTAETDSGGQKRGPGADAWHIYLQKTYMKTASLIAKSARAAVTLGGCKEGDIWREIAYAYGRNLGIAFQLADDMLDYESIDTTLGKPSGADLQLGLATAPALYAWEEYPEMGDLIQRKFRNRGDVELARDYVARSSALQRTRVLAQTYADKAKEVLALLPDSQAKTALETLTDIVVERKK